ncbi:MAG: tripartite tricarboxylate transporter permease [Thermodesulfobacteriota bacterium]
MDFREVAVTMDAVLAGFSVALQPWNLLFCLMGCLVGTLVGVLPGLGPVAAISILLPTTFKAGPIAGIIMLAGIYYGAMYGGSITSILVNLPGEAASVVTCIDGYQMARQGRAGPALGICAIGSFIGGTLSVLGLMLVAAPLADAALAFGPPEYFGLMTIGMVVVTFLAGKSMTKSLLMAAVGIFLGCVGMDVISAKPRFTLGLGFLEDGLGLVPVIMGLYGIAEVFSNLEDTLKVSILDTKIQGIWPTGDDFRRSIGPILRGTGLGFFTGVLPGGGAVLSSFLSYGMEKKLSREPQRFGSGAIEGVAGPETANNAATGGAFIPLFILGLPFNVVSAVLLGAMIIYGVRPGPMLLSTDPGLFWGVVASMYVGNAMLLVLNLPLVGLWVKMLKIPYPLFFPLIVLFCLIGVFSINHNINEIYVMLAFGVVGYLLRKFEYEAAPLILAMVLGPMYENALRQSLIMSDGSYGIFFSRPLSATCLIFAALLLIVPHVRRVTLWRKKAIEFAEADG